MLVLNQIKSSKHIKFFSLKSDRKLYSTIIASKDKNYLNIEIGGENLKFPHVWLRDNCQCEKCFHSSAKSRMIDWSKFNINVQPKDFTKDDRSLRITWDDGHRSQYELIWLKFRSFSTKNQENYTECIYKPAKSSWKGTEFQKICSRYDYKEVLKSDIAFHDWLEKLSIYGVALIQNTPDSETAVDSIVDKIGFTRRTHYGVKFTVQHVPNTSNVAYLSNNLQIHTDLPYYEYSPGVNMLHCLVQTDSIGGENLLADGHFAANYIKVNYPKQYKLLIDTEVEWSDIGIENGNKFFKLNRSPVICLDRHGEIIRINFSVPQRGSNLPVALENVKPWYEAYSLFYELNNKFAARFKTKPGDILTFDNIRLIHGRNAYEDHPGNVRKLIGAYLDWDEIYSRLRCLKVKLKDEDKVYY